MDVLLDTIYCDIAGNFTFDYNNKKKHNHDPLTNKELKPHPLINKIQSSSIKSNTKTFCTSCRTSYKYTK